MIIPSDGLQNCTHTHLVLKTHPQKKYWRGCPTVHLKRMPSDFTWLSHWLVTKHWRERRRAFHPLSSFTQRKAHPQILDKDAALHLTQLEDGIGVPLLTPPFTSPLNETWKYSHRMLKRMLWNAFTSSFVDSPLKNSPLGPSARAMALAASV